MKNIIVVIMAALLLLSIGHAEPTLWYVHPDSALNSIQAALDACADSDTVLVGPGIYIENIIWPNTQNIHLISELGPEVTIIDGDQRAVVIVLESRVDSTTVISGFTIRNGHSGIGCYDASSPTITDNIIRDNVTTGEGGGITCRRNSSPIIRKNTVINNTATYGGGIYCFGSDLRIDSCTIAENSRHGIFTAMESTVRVLYCNIESNIGYAAYNYCDTASIVAEYNWWGHATGPYYTTNPGGMGDTVSKYVGFTPWLTEPVDFKEEEIVE